MSNENHKAFLRRIAVELSGSLTPHMLVTVEGLQRANIATRTMAYEVEVALIKAGWLYSDIKKHLIERGLIPEQNQSAETGSK